MDNPMTITLKEVEYPGNPWSDTTPKRTYTTGAFVDSLFHPGITTPKPIDSLVHIPIQTHSKPCLFVFNQTDWVGRCHHGSVHLLANHGVELSDIFFEAFSLATMSVRNMDFDEFVGYLNSDALDDIHESMDHDQRSDLSVLQDAFIHCCHSAYELIFPTISPIVEQIFHSPQSRSYDYNQTGILVTDPRVVETPTSLYCYMTLEY